MNQMKLSLASLYALHAAVHMALQKHKHATVASHDIASERGIPSRFLVKLLRPLVTARILHSVKGPNGGYRLARSPSEISLLDIIEAVDGPIRGEVPERPTDRDEECSPSRIAKCNQTWNNLRSKLEEACGQAAEQQRKSLMEVRISDLVGES
jgi:Rrf2 family protein